jgi:hypothetical protein
MSALGVIRYGVPAVMAAAGTVLYVVGDTFVGAMGLTLIGSAVLVFLAGMLVRFSIDEMADRDRDQEARDHYAEHGRWPGDPEPGEPPAAPPPPAPARPPHPASARSTPPASGPGGCGGRRAGAAGAEPRAGANRVGGATSRGHARAAGAAQRLSAARRRSSSARPRPRPRRRRARRRPGR